MNHKLTLLLLLLFTSVSYAEVDLVKIDKSERMMYLMDGEKIIKEYKVALGKHPIGHKEQEGDGKTPEGTYKLEFVMEPGSPHGESDYYKSMHVSYPNEEDEENARKKGIRPGGDIKVHGQPNGFSWFSFITQRFDWTSGCIGIKNSEMDEFLELVKVGIPIKIDP